MDPRADSEALHARVRAFAHAARIGSRDAEGFARLACDIASFQVSTIPGYARLVAAHGGLGAGVDDIPAVPVDAFRLVRLAAHPPRADAARFETSGTTGSRPGVHAFRTLETYRTLALLSGRDALRAGEGPITLTALAQDPHAGASDPAGTSSLGFMMRSFMEEWDGRSLSGHGPFDSREPGRWLLGPGGVDVAGLERVSRVARARGEPLLVLATGFALALFLDSREKVQVPSTTVVMPTGGFKGRTREIDPGELVRDLSGRLGIPEEQIVFEYGMTELSSQLYEGVLPGARLRGERGVYVPPPWLRVTPVDPESLRPVSPGEAGIARFVDLGNVDSAVAIVTQDLVRARGGGIELLGRRPGAPSRGCSLAVEELVTGARA